MVFASFSMMLGITFVIFLGEISSKKMYQCFLKLNEKWKYTRKSTIYQSDADETSSTNKNQTEGMYRNNINDRLLELEV